MKKSTATNERNGEPVTGLSEGRDEVGKATKRQREAIGDHCVKIKASKAEVQFFEKSYTVFVQFLISLR